MSWIFPPWQMISATDGGDPSLNPSPNRSRKFSVEVEIAVYRVELPHNTQQLSHSGYVQNHSLLTTSTGGVSLTTYPTADSFDTTN